MKLRFFFLLALLGFCAQQAVDAQLLTFGDTDDDVILSVAYDGSGNVFYMGTFNGTVDFDPSDGPDGQDTFTASGFVTGFICSYTTGGVFRFAFPLIGTVACAPEAFAVTSSGDLLVAGGFAGTVDFDPGAATENRTANAVQASAFVASYSNTGTFQSVFVLGDSGETVVYVNALDVDAADNLYLSGTIEGTHDMDPSGSTHELAATSGNDEIFMASYDASGAFRFARLITDSVDIDVRDVAVDLAGNSFVVGEFEGTTDFDDSDGQDADDTISVVNSSDGFVASFSPTGVFRFAFRLGAFATQGATGAAVDGDGNFYVTGDAYVGTDFDPGVAEEIMSVGGGCFLASYSNGGALRFVVSTRGLSAGESKGMAVAARGDDVYVGGIFRGLRDFAPGDPEGHGMLDTASTAFNEKDVFLLKFQKDGSIVWARSFDTQQTSALVLSPYGARDIAISPSGQVTIAGSFEPDAADFDPSIDVAAVTGAGKEDAFAVQLDSAGYLPGSTLPSFVVTNTADAGDGSLRRALEFANHTPMTDTITFTIPGAGPHVISPLTPFVTKYPVNIDGLSQPGASAVSWPPDLRIVLDGTSAGSGVNGFDLVSKFISTPRFVRGLVIQNFGGYGLEVGDDYRAFTLTDCYIGTAVDGITAAPNASGGIYDVSGETSFYLPELQNYYGTAGGSTFGRNLISGNGGPGIYSVGSDLVTVQNNYIGTPVAGTAALPNSGHGIHLAGSENVTIGGFNPAEANLIAYNSGGGIHLSGFAEEARFYGNSIHGNGGLGIEYDSSTPSVNDIADQDDHSPNKRMNYPILETAILSHGQTRVDGWLDGIPGGRFRLEFFSNPVADPSGSGEGETFLGASWVHTSGGPAMFSVVLPAVSPGHVISATATADERSINGEGTSEFSPVVPVLVPNVTTLADSGPGSFRQALTDANSSPGPDILLLDPALAGQVLTLTTDLPVITGSTTIQAPDGFTISGNSTRRPLTINAPGAEVTLINLILEDGSATDGGGILHTNGTLNLRRCIIQTCTATGDGGALAVQAGVVNVEDCQFIGNHANGSGGGIARQGGDLNVDRALLTGNSAGVSGGGGYCNEGVFGQPAQRSSYLNTTFCNNSAPLGGGFRRDSGENSSDIGFCTLVENMASTRGGGISVEPANLTAVNCIVSSNTAPAAPDAENISAIDNFIGGNPMLGPLRNNGGYVPTFALLTGSPAIDDYPSSSGSGTDARLAPRNSGDRADRGAFEYYEGSSAEEAPSYYSWSLSLPAGDRDELADPNGDGISNLESMYFGLYALGANDGRRFGLRLSDAGDVVLNYSVPNWLSGTDVSGSIWVADELPSASKPDPWSAAPPSVELGSTTATIDYELTVPTNAHPQKFIKFEISN